MDLLLIKPMFAMSAIQFAFDKATPEGKITICFLALVSMLSWTVIITKGRQLWRARKIGKKFFAAYRATRDPLDLHRKKQQFAGAPAYEVYSTGAEEMSYHLEHNPVQFNGKTKINRSAFDFVRVAMERMVSAEGMGLEKGMIILSTAVAGGPFIGLLGTVWGVMETFSGVGQANAATLTAMAPGVAGALIATVIGLLVAIPAMFAYNFMVTQVRGITQQLDDFATEFATQLDHIYVDPRESHEAAPLGLTPEPAEGSAEELKTAPQTTHLARASLTGS
jgi:biopolymer transport protein ExbB/TolQ